MIGESELAVHEVDCMLTASGHVVHLVPDRQMLRRRRELYYRRAKEHGTVPRDLPVQMIGGWVRRLRRRLGVWTRRLQPWQRRSLLRACRREVSPGELSRLRDIWDTRGMVGSLHHFAELVRDHGLDMDELPDEVPDEVCQVIRTYRRRLGQEGAADKPGLFSEIIAALRADDSLRFDRIVVDGFCHLPPSEQRLLRAAAERTDCLRVLVPADRRVVDVYPTDEQLRREWGIPGEHIERYFPDLASSPLAGRLFRVDPTDLEIAEPEHPRIHLWTVTDEREQNERIAGFLKRKLVGKYDPGDCCVVVRDEEQRAALARHFYGVGVPVSTSSDIPLEQTRTGGMIQAVLDAIECPSVGTIYHLASFPHVSGEWEVLRRLPAYVPAEREVEGQEIRHVLDAVRSSLQHRQQSDSLRMGSRERQNEAIGELRELDRRLEVLLDALQAPEGSASSACARHLMEVLETLRAGETLQNMLIGDGGRIPEVIADLSAWRYFCDRMERGIDRSLLPRARYVETGWSDFAEMIREFLHCETVPVPEVPGRAAMRPRAGRGVSISCDEAPGSGQYRIIVLPYMSSGTYPRRSRPGWLEDAFLGEELRDPTSEQREENYFFYRCACAAADDLLLVFPQEVEEVPQVPSPYLQEVEMATSAGTVDFTAREVPGQSPDPDRVASWRQLRTHVLATGELSGKSGALVERSLAVDGVDRGLFWLSLRASRARHSARWSEWDGDVGDADVLGVLRERFPSRATVSPTDLERYAGCPFRFYLQEVLGLSPRYRVEGEIPPYIVGRLYHAVLEAYYRRYAEDTALGQPPDQEEERQFVHRRVQEWSRQLAASMAWLDDHFFASLQRRTEEVLCRFLTYERERRESAGDEEYLFTWQMEKQFSLDMTGVSPGGEDLALTVEGVMDRVDRTEDPAAEEPDAAVVFDYKMGTQPPGRDDMLSGRDLQVPIYIAAAREILSDLRVLGGGYLSISGRHARGGLYLPEAAELLHLNPERHAVTPDELSEALDACRRQIMQYWGQIRSGFFPLWPEEERYCSWCDFSPICRHESSRVRRKGENREEADR